MLLASLVVEGSRGGSEDAAAEADGADGARGCKAASAERCAMRAGGGIAADVLPRASADTNAALVVRGASLDGVCTRIGAGLGTASAGLGTSTDGFGTASAGFGTASAGFGTSTESARSVTGDGDTTELSASTRRTAKKLIPPIAAAVSPTPASHRPKAPNREAPNREPTVVRARAAVGMATTPFGAALWTSIDESANDRLSVGNNGGSLEVAQSGRQTSPETSASLSRVVADRSTPTPCARASRHARRNAATVCHRSSFSNRRAASIAAASEGGRSCLTHAMDRAGTVAAARSLAWTWGPR